MIRYLSEKALDDVWRIAHVMAKFENTFHKLSKKYEIDDVKLEFIDKEYVESSDNIYARRLLDDSSSLAGTYVNHRIRECDDINDYDTLVREVKCIIFIKMSTVNRLSRFNPYSNRLNYCIRFILLHEIGHILDFRGNVGKPAVQVTILYNQLIKEYDKIMEPIKTNGGVFGIEQWLDVNNSKIERFANTEVGITEKDLRKFFNFMALV